MTARSELPRRSFLRRLASASAAAIASLLSACGITAAPAPTAAPSPHPVLLPTSTKTSPPDPTPMPPTDIPPTPTPAPTATQTAAPDPRTPVAVVRAADYDLNTLRTSLAAALDGIGGVADIIKPGARVAVKVNLTDGAMWVTPSSPPAHEVYLTHPAVVQALCELLRDAGASEISIVEGIVEEQSWDVFGYRAAAEAVGAALVDLNFPDPYPAFASVSVPGFLIHETLMLNPLLTEVDAFISVPKMKVHYTAGLTLALKNLIGIAPLSLYRNQADHNYRSALHGGFTDGIDRRLIRSIIDLNLARPVDLAIIDGVWTCDGGEAPWQTGMAALRPGVLVAARNAVAADAVSAALMGFDPCAPDRATPFNRAENHLRMAAENGLGPSDLSEIRVVGEGIETARIAFRPVP